ncbi:unnamed protein product [Adineta ricciae]|uniref:Uncharacterized protein n=1 Tax=Adineta ricciae TaxID=249248 RepID=A0A815IXY8_ADIRI|nr:unnamed protein product [Adineta ricciae]
MNRINLNISHMALIFISSWIYLSTYSIVALYADEFEENSLDFSPLSNEDGFIDNLGSLWENTCPPDAVSYTELSHTVIENRLEGNLCEIRFSPEIMTYCDDTLLIGESTILKLIISIQISFYDQFDNILVDNFGNLIQYMSHPHELGHLINIFHTDFSFYYAKCLLNLQSNSNFDLNNLFFHFSPSSIGNTTGIINGPTIFTVGLDPNIYTVSIKCPSDATCMWMLDRKVIFTSPNTNITLAFNENDVGNRTLFYVKFIKNKCTILASLLLHLLPKLTTLSSTALTTLMTTIETKEVQCRQPCSYIFLPPDVYETDDDLYSLIVIDLNGDNRPDIVAVGHYSNVVYVSLNEKNGTFPLFTNYSLTDTPRSLVVIDVNNDDASDIVIITDDKINGGGGGINILLNLGNGSFFPPSNYQLEFSPWLLSVKDLNDDNVPDIVLGGISNNHIEILLNLGNGTFIPSTNHSLNNEPTSLVIMDLNNDTAPDIAVASKNCNCVEIFLNLRNGTFFHSAKYVVTSPKILAIKDLNSDGAPDQGYQLYPIWGYSTPFEPFAPQKILYLWGTFFVPHLRF